MSKLHDMSGIEDCSGKGTTPKEYIIPVDIYSWAYGKELYDCHQIMMGSYMM